MASRESSGEESPAERFKGVWEGAFPGGSSGPYNSQVPPKNQSFATGATRSADAHKIDYEGHLSPEALHYFGEYMHTHRIQRDRQTRASDNWQAGIPLHKYMKSLLRHTFDLWRAWRGSVTHNPDTGAPQTLGELCSAILFNVQGMLHELIQHDGITEHTSLRPDLRREIEAGRMPFVGKGR